MAACKKQKTYVASGLAQGHSLVDLVKHADMLLVDRTVIETDDTVDVNLNSMSGELHALDGIQTPYGSLTKQFEFTEDDDPTPRTIQYICPFALMHYLAGISAVFFEFMRFTLGALGRPANLFLYADEVTPGNDKRCDGGRKYVAWFWGLADMPQWFHQRHDMPSYPFAYVPYGFLPSKYSMTRLYRRIVHIFFSQDSFNFEITGVRLQNGPNRFDLKAKYAATPADEEALRAVKSVKGHSGRKPCMHCKNVLGRVGSLADFGDDDPYCLHVLSPNVQRCDLHTPSSFGQMADDLVAAVAAGRNIHDMEIELVSIMSKTEHRWMLMCGPSRKV